MFTEKEHGGVLPKTLCIQGHQPKWPAMPKSIFTANWKRDGSIDRVAFSISTLTMPISPVNPCLYQRRTASKWFATPCQRSKKITHGASDGDRDTLTQLSWHKAGYESYKANDVTDG